MSRHLLPMVLFTGAFFLFGVAAYVSTTLAGRLTRLAFALIVLVWLLA
jgi:hypothetical protein